MKIVRIIMLFACSFALLSGCATTQVNKPAEEMFKDGEHSFRSGRYEDAIEQWKRVKESYFSPELSARAELGIADAYFLNEDYIEAAAAYEDFRKLHPSHEKAAFALFRQGMSNFMQINQIDTDQTPVKNALLLFESYIKTYPGSQNMADALQKYRECKDKLLRYEVYVGRFYMREDKFPAAIARFEESLLNFPESTIKDEVLYYLGRAYLQSGQRAKGREIFGRLFREYPQSPYISEANKAMDKFF